MFSALCEKGKQNRYLLWPSCVSQNKMYFMLLPHPTVVLKQRRAEIYKTANKLKCLKKHDAAAVVLSETHWNK